MTCHTYQLILDEGGDKESSLEFTDAEAAIDAFQDAESLNEYYTIQLISWEGTIQ